MYVCIFSFHFVGFSLSGDQPLGGVRFNWFPHRPHRLHHRHCGGRAGKDQIPSGQTEYPKTPHGCAEGYKHHLLFIHSGGCFPKAPFPGVGNAGFTWIECLS